VLKLLEDKFILEFSNNDNDDKNKKIGKRKTRKQTIDLTIGDIACFGYILK
jgi:hypothetical protein